MALYSGGLKSVLIDDTHFSNNRVEFRFQPNTMYYSNIKLVNLGAKGTATLYNPIAGCYGVVKHIRLLNGREVLDEMRFANEYLAFDNLLSENAYNRDYKGKLSKNQVGYAISRDATIVGGDRNPAQRTENETIDVGGAKPSLGSLDVRRCLGLLNKMNVLDTSLFQHLKLEVEFETDIRNVLLATAGAYSPTEPLLIADEITDDQLVDANRKAMGNVVWNAIESDLVQIPNANATAGALVAGATAKQNVSLKVNGFDRKLLSRIVMMKSFSDKTENVNAGNVVGAGAYGSKTQHLEVVNVSINGKKHFAGSGLGGTNPASKLKMLSDTWGSLNIAPCDNLQSVGLDDKENASANVEGFRPKNGDRHNALVGQLDFIGFSISNRINDFNLDYERTLVLDTEDPQIYNTGLNVRMMAEVSKSLIIDKAKGAYQVRYN